LVRRHIALVATLCAAVLFSAPVAGAAPRDASSEKLRKSVTLAGLTEHLENLQAIADANDGTRATGTPGYEASVDYVVERLTKAGYDVELDPFNYPTWEENAPSTLTFGSTTYTSANATDMITFGFSPSGSLSNVAVVPVDIVIHSDPVSRSTSGCEDTDFTSSVVGKIALIQRGTCPFVQKLANAEEAGAVGVVLFNEGNTPARQAPSFIEAPTDLGIPAVYVNYAIGKALYDAFQAGQAPAVSLTVDATTTPRFFDNVIAYSRTGDPDNTVMLGAHLDSVEEGPGVNDNGSGSATLLETAEAMAKLAKNKNKGALENRVAFAFWGAEEAGLVGSISFVEHLSQAERDDIMANLNFDMLASPNFARLVYDGDGSSFGVAGPDGSDVIEHVFNDYFESQGLAYEATEFSGRSDYGPFIEAGIP
jgi:Zn-dependent M28 family amino/carboxypeptidase